MAIVKSILVPTDFSSNSSSAINYACELAKSSRARLHVLNVTKDKHDSRERAKALERLGHAIDARSELELDTVKSVIEGNAGIEIAKYARDNHVDIIVMGTHGRTGLAHLAMGSVAANVLKNSPCPVTVLGPHDAENISHSQAFEVIETIVGDGLQIAEEKGRAQMLKALVAELRISSTTAILMLDELENRQWVNWEDGVWFVVEGEELLDQLEPISFQAEPDTQSIELIKRAKKLRATDIHIDPCGDSQHVVRLRIDGRLREYCKLDRSVGEHLINQCKTISNIDQTDPFHAHEGRVQLPNSMRDLEVRMTSIPVPEGQAVALRILDPLQIFRPLTDLGLSSAAFESVQNMLRKGEGLILVTGPTGSGKTTTVYSMLEMVGGHDQNIVSIEDPVEFMAPFVRQLSVDPKHGLDMSTGLRTLLRMDPDVLFIGEIRDREAAEIAVRAASSGKYVFSTLHTRDIASSITSLRNLGLGDGAIAANLAGILNQRLVRILCNGCKNEIALSFEQQAAYEKHFLQIPNTVYGPIGCAACSGTGYKGRVGVFEIATIEEPIRNVIQSSGTQDEIADCLRANKIHDLHADGLAKAAQGMIGVDDALAIGWLN